MNAYLSESGIRAERDKRWDDAERRIVLANLLREHEDLPALQLAPSPTSQSDPEPQPPEPEYQHQCQTPAKGSAA